MRKVFDNVKIMYYMLLFAFFPLVISRIAKLYFITFYKDGVRRHQVWYHKKQASYCQFFLCKSIPKVNVEVINDNNEDFERPAIIIANHQSMLDIPAIFMLHPRIVGMAKEALFQNKLFSTMTKYKELISNATPVRTVVEYARNKMEAGFSFLIFPEGTRSKTRNVLPFQAGAFFFAESLKCDIIPVTIYGTGNVLPVNGLTGTGPIVVEIGKRQEYDGMNRKQMATYWHDYFAERLAIIQKKMQG